MDVQDDVYTIHHVESLRRKTEYYWPGIPGYPWNGLALANYRGRPALNLGPLISTLSVESDECAAEAGSSTSGRVSLKRKRLEATPGPSKRIKLDDEVQRAIKLGYPAFWTQKFGPGIERVIETDEDTSFFQVYQFALNLRYDDVVHHGSEHCADDRTAERLGWLEEEREFSSLLKRRQANPSLPQEIDLGRFFMMRFHGRFLAHSQESGSSLSSVAQKHDERWLFLLPDMPWPDGLPEDILEEQAIQPSDMHRDLIAACAVLQSRGRLKLEANLKLHVLSEGTYDHSSNFPFELRAQFTLSLAIPASYHPFGGVSSQREISELEGLQRRLICVISKVPFAHHVDNTERDGATDVTIPFFLNMMRPAPPLPQAMNYESLQPEGLLSTLMPFQRRTVAWMLEREGKGVTPAGTLGLLGDPDSSWNTASKCLPPFWEEIKMGGRNFFFNRLTSALSPTRPESHAALGGIVAEEPGLGKTMECLSLILLNPAPERDPTKKRWDPEAQLHVKEIKVVSSHYNEYSLESADIRSLQTTLIVTPPAIAAQWAEELATDAPSLKVFVYEGWASIKLPVTEADVEVERESWESKAKSKTKAEQNGRTRASALQADDVILDWASYINQFDVCITTYNVLRSDIFVARAPPKRPRRQDAEYKILMRPRSPLLVCEWYRVIMDEVQMMGTGKTEEMVSLIPRLSSFAVSGTPARAKATDLIGVLRFLRIDDLVAPSRMWDRLLKHGFKDLFAALFQRYSVRTLKSSVKSELTIPQQQRYLVGIELGRVERHVYDQALGDALMELGLDARGVAAYEGWEVDASVLRNALRRLRGICTHPQVGQLQKQGEKLNRSGALKSMTDVLEAMKEQNWRNLTEDRRARILTLSRLAQLQQHHAGDRDRYQRALEHLLTAETEANQLIDEIKASIVQHNLKGETLKKEAQVLRDSRKAQIPDRQHTEKNSVKGKGKEPDRDLGSQDDLDSDFDDDEDVEDRGLPKTPAGEEHRSKRIALLARLRECLMVLHRVKFLQGDVYHVLGSSYSEKEDAAYADAESLRKDLLRSTEEAANRAMQRLSTAATEKRVTERALQISLPFMKDGGIRSAHLFEEANEIIEDVLNEQAVLLWQWRTEIVQLLTRRLNSAGEHADGEEYSRTLDTQGEAEVYMQAYAALLADRREAIAAERTLLAVHEGREKKTRKTKAAARAKLRMEENLEVPEDIDVQPQHEVLYGQLLEQRKELQISDRALKSVMVDLAAVSIRLPKENDPEKIIAKEGTAKLRELMAKLQDLTDKLDVDLAILRKVFNDRIIYFRQLQEISDTVAEVQWEGTVVDAIGVTQRDNADLLAKINTKRARQRYLEHLAEDGSRVCEDDTLCILCQCEFLRGFITQCAHMFCEGCLKAWIARGHGRACPVCRAPIDPTQLERFTIQEDQPPPPQPVSSDGELLPVSHRKIQYNLIDPMLFTDIQMMESSGSYGSKIQMLVRHLLHIQAVDSGAKSIVFSAWADSLAIVEHALHSNGIPCLRLDRNQGKKKDGGATKFRTDPTIQVLLLHGERDNAGLNFTCASRVFLLESVVNHGFEVQAIARIDRMGQVRATEVFCYYAEDTVEKNILDLAARQGLSLYTKDNSAGSLDVTSFAMDSGKNRVDSPARSSKKGQAPQKGDFIFKVDDMLAILFPHMFEDVEYLLPPDAHDEAPFSSTNAQSTCPLARRVYVNAEAGPSRLPAP